MHPIIKSFMDFFKTRDAAKKPASRMRVAAIAIPAGPIQLPLFQRRGIERQKAQIRHQRLRTAARFRLQAQDPTLHVAIQLMRADRRAMKYGGRVVGAVPRGVIVHRTNDVLVAA